MNNNWDWEKYGRLMRGESERPDIQCKLCGSHKSVQQVVCSVCFEQVIDSRNGAYPERMVRV
jgi:hypothetical protein